MGPVVVVVRAPSVEPACAVVESANTLPSRNSPPQRLVPPLDLARRGRRPRRGQQMTDPVLPADPIEQHLTGARPEAAGEHLAVVGQHLRRAPHGRASPSPTRHTPAGLSPAPPPAPTHRTANGHRSPTRSTLSRHQRDAPHQRCPSATAPSTGTAPNACNRPGASATLLRLDQPMTHQTPINRRPPRQRHHPIAVQPMTDRARPPPRMLTTQLHDPRLHLRRHLMRTRPRHRRLINQTGQTLRRIPTQPPMHRLTLTPNAPGHLAHRRRHR